MYQSKYAEQQSRFDHPPYDGTVAQYFSIIETLLLRQVRFTQAHFRRFLLRFRYTILLHKRAYHVRDVRVGRVCVNFRHT